jgi:hypothetical protein
VRGAIQYRISNHNWRNLLQSVQQFIRLKAVLTIATLAP